MADKVINIDIKTNTEGVKSLKQELRETVQALQQMPAGTKEFDEMTMKAAELKDRMADINEQVNVFASGSKYERVSNSLGEIGSAIRNLDFEKAQDRAGAFAKAAKGISFADAIASVKQLGTTFLTLGKALLTNPLFLLAAVIIAIVVAIVKLLDNLGILKKIMDAIDKAIGVVVDALKELSDWLGITDFAGEEAHKNEMKRLEEAQLRRKMAMDAFILMQKGIISSLDNEISVRKAQGKETTEIEREKLKVIRNNAEAEMRVREMQAKAVAALTGVNSKAYQETLMQIEEAKQVFLKAQADIDAFEAGVMTNRRQRATEANKLKDQELAKERQMLEQLRLLRLQQEQDLYNQIEAIENEYYNSKLSKEQQEINAAREKYNAVIQAAKNAAEQMMASATTEDEQAAAQELIDRAAVLEEAQQAAIKEIQDKYEDERRIAAQAEKDAKKAADEEEIRKEQEKIDKKRAMMQTFAAQTSQLLSAIASMVDTNAQNEIKAAAGNEKKQEELRKKAFEKNKKMQLAMAVVNAAQGILSAMAAPFPINIGMAVVAAATGIANIAKITSTKYESPGSAPTAPNTAAATSAAENAMPSFNLFGTGGNSQQNAGIPSMENQMVVKAVVTESDITETQGKVNKYALNAEL
jgi:hypothetical protein